MQNSTDRDVVEKIRQLGLVWLGKLEVFDNPSDRQAILDGLLQKTPVEVAKCSIDARCHQSNEVVCVWFSKTRDGSGCIRIHTLISIAVGWS